MHDVLKSDIFFVVTTVAVIFIAVAVFVALVYVIRILRDANKVSGAIREEGEEIIRDIGDARLEVKKQGKSLMGIMKDLVRSFASKQNRKK